VTSGPAGREATQGPPDRAAKWLARLAVLVAAWTLVLLFAGGLVTSLRAGLAVPDWPTSYGYAVNPPDWTERPNLREEHGHRLLGWVLGMLVIGLAVAVQRLEPRRGVRRLAWAVLGAVCLQGILGGARVQWLQHWLAPVHGALGQAVFALLVVLAVLLSRDWLRSGPPLAIPEAGRIRRATLVAAAAIYVQVVVGVVVRHRLSFADQAGEPVTGAGAYLVEVLPHVGWGIVALGCGFAAVAAALGASRRVPSLGGPARLLGVGLGLQVLLGSATWLTALGGNAEIVRPGYQVWTATAHQAAGAAVFAAAVVLALRARRHLAAPAAAVAGEGAPSPVTAGSAA
jgi:cytochrome c oxidase assembly protein subunit 15